MPNYFITGSVNKDLLESKLLELIPEKGDILIFKTEDEEGVLYEIYKNEGISTELTEPDLIASKLLDVEREKETGEKETFYFSVERALSYSKESEKSVEETLERILKANSINLTLKDFTISSSRELNLLVEPGHLKIFPKLSEIIDSLYLLPNYLTLISSLDAMLQDLSIDASKIPPVQLTNLDEALTNWIKRYKDACTLKNKKSINDLNQALLQVEKSLHVILPHIKDDAARAKILSAFKAIALSTLLIGLIIGALYASVGLGVGVNILNAFLFSFTPQPIPIMVFAKLCSTVGTVVVGLVAEALLSWQLNKKYFFPSALNKILYAENPYGTFMNTARSSTPQAEPNKTEPKAEEDEKNEDNLSKSARTSRFSFRSELIE